MKNQKGITLIALIITILVMLILAAVTINLVIDEDGILSKAQSATSKMSMSEIKERAELVAMDVKTDLKIGETVMGVKATCMQKLAKSFGVSLEDEEVKNGNKLTVAGGKYDIIVKNANLDIEVREHSDIIENDELIEIMHEANEVQLDGLRQIDIKVKAKILIDFNDYKEMKQSQEKKEELKEDATFEEKKNAVWKFLSEKYTEDSNKVKSVDELFCFILNDNEYGITHDDLTDWLTEGIVLEKFGKPEGSTVTKGQIYNALLTGKPSDAEKTIDEVYYWLLTGENNGSLTEQEAIETGYTKLINAQKEQDEKEKEQAYKAEYDKYTKNLKMKGSEKGKEITEIYIYIPESGNETVIKEFTITQNGKYEILIMNSEEKVIGSEIFQINSIAISDDSLYIPEDKNDKWEVSTYSGTGEATITGYLGTNNSAIVPKYIGKYAVTRIKLSSNTVNNKLLKKITISDSVTNIGNFSGCTSLEEIVMSNSVTKIELGAFSGIKTLKKVTLSDSLESIESYAFKDTSVEKIIIPNSVVEMDYGIFENCTSLNEVTISNSLTELKTDTFLNCTSLKEVVIPNSMTTIGWNVFKGCTSLERIAISNSVTNIQKYAFAKTAVKEVIIPNSVTAIDEYAFSDCISLENITIPNSVKSIGKYCFKGCTSLISISIPDSITGIQESTFSDCTSLKEVILPNSIVSIWGSAFKDCTSLEEITIPNSVDYICTLMYKNSFAGCTNLKKITFKKGPNSIPGGQPWGATNATVIDENKLEENN